MDDYRSPVSDGWHLRLRSLVRREAGRGGISIRIWRCWNSDLRARNRRNTTIESLKSGGIDNGRRVSLGQLTEIVVPVLGPGMKQCEISGIEKRVGDFVQAGETLVDVAADQVSVSIPASTAGVVFDIPVAVG